MHLLRNDVEFAAIINQGFWEQLKLSDPKRFEDERRYGSAHDPSHPDDIFVEIGTCSLS